MGRPPRAGSTHLPRYFLLDIILPAEQKERREEGNFNSTPEWRVSYNQCIQGHITGCHWDSITWRRWGWWLNGILTPVKGGTSVRWPGIKGLARTRMRPETRCWVRVQAADVSFCPSLTIPHLFQLLSFSLFLSRSP